MRARNDEGQAVPLVLAVLVLVVLLAVGLAGVGRTAVDAAAARTAADAAALAGARGDDGEARAVAAANGGELVSLTRTGDDTVVTVRVGGRTATARARADPIDPTGARPVGGPVELARVRGFTVHARIAAQFAALLDAAAADGIVLTGGAYRSNDAQIALRRAHCGPSQYDIWEKPSSQCSPPTARPGHSMHEQGLAIDFSYRGRIIGSRSSPPYRWLAAHAAAYGFFNLPSEPWHWSVNGR